jgi:hypothetical protein
MRLSCLNRFGSWGTPCDTGQRRRWGAGSQLHEVAVVARLGTVSEHARGRAVSGVQDQHFRVYGVGGMGVRETGGVDGADRPAAV